MPWSRPAPERPLFDRCLEVALYLEVGENPKNPTGYTNHPMDPGGETRFGICKRSHPTVDIRALTLTGATVIYRTEYWWASGAEQWGWPLALYHFDAAVNQGLGWARRFLKQAHEPESYLLLREERYRAIAANPAHPEGAFWLPGWLNRLRLLRVSGQAGTLITWKQLVARKKAA